MKTPTKIDRYQTPTAEFRVNNSVRMSLDAWGASLLPDILGAPFQMIRLPIASSDETMFRRRAIWRSAAPKCQSKIDTTSAAHELVFHVPRAIAQFERWLISERTKDGIATARKHGRNPGRPPLQPETISALQDLVEAGKSVSQAAKHLTPVLDKRVDGYSKIGRYLI